MPNDLTDRQVASHIPKRHKRQRPPHPDALAYSIDEAAHVLGLSRTMVYEFLNSGRLASYKVKARRLIDREDVVKLHQELKVAGAA